VRFTRRQFLASAAAVLPFQRLRFGALSRLVDETHGCVLLDLAEQCSLRESLSGYVTALGPRAQLADAPSRLRCHTLIVPAAVELPPPALQSIETCLDSGGRVILESGAGFASRSEFQAHRAVLASLQIDVQAPMELWPRPRSRGIPYIEYTWPIHVQIRDFSRVVPLRGQAGDVIASVDGLPVALRRPSGSGTLLVLGSPLGPALWAGDSEARRWLEASVLP